MTERDLRRFADQLEMAVEDIVGQSQAGTTRSPLPEELIPDAMRFLTAVMDGMAEAEYARLHPATYKRLCERNRLEGRETS